MFSEGSDKKFITLKEAAEISGYTSDHLARLARNSEIHGKRIGRVWLIDRNELEDYLSSQNRDGSLAKRDFITLKEASKLAGYTADHISRLIRNREIEGKRVGRRWFVLKNGLEDYITERNDRRKRQRVFREDIIKREQAEKAKERFGSYVSNFEKAISSITNPTADFISEKIGGFKKASLSVYEAGQAPKAETVIFENPREPEEEKDEAGLNVAGDAESIEIKSQDALKALKFDFSSVKNGALSGFGSVVFVYVISGMLAYAGYVPSVGNDKLTGRLESIKNYSHELLESAEFVYESVLDGAETSNLEAGLSRIFSNLKDAYRKANDEFTDFLGESYLALTEKLIPGYSPYNDLIVFPSGERSRPDTDKPVVEKITEIIREQVETVTKIQPIKEIIKETEIVRETEVIKETEVITKEGADTLALGEEIDALKRNISIINGDIANIRSDVISRVNNVSRGGGLPSIPSDLSSGDTINSLTLGAISDLTGSNAFEVQSGNILYSSGGTINQSGTGQVTFSGNVDATNGLDVTGNLTVSGTSAFTGQATFSNTTTSFNGVSYGFPSAAGTSGQALTINSSGLLSWSTVAGSNFFTDGGTFTYLTTTTQDLVLGDSDTTGAPFFFDVSTRRLGINVYDGVPASLLELQDNDSGLNSAGSNVVLTINNASTTAFDPYIDFRTASTTRWLVGVDDSDSDKFRIATGAFASNSIGLTLQTDGFLGINDTTPGSLLTVSATGTLTFGDFNDNIIDDMESTVLNWTASDPSNTATSTATSTDPSSTTAPKVGTQALRITTSGNASVGDTVTKSFSSNQDWSSFETIGFWIYATKHSSSTSQIISIQLNDTSTGILDHNITMQDTNRWQYEEWDLSATTTAAFDAVSSIRFLIDNATSSPTFVIDHIRLYDDNERTSELYVDADGNAVFQGRAGIEFVTGTGNSGQLPNIKISSATVEINNPLNINVGGDVGIDHDLQFLNTGTSYITSEGPLRIEAGDANHAENLTLGTQGIGDVVIDVANSTTSGTGGFKVLGVSGYVARLDPNGQFVIGSATTSTAPFYFNSSARRMGINVYDGVLSSTLELQDNDSGLNSAGSNVVLTINNASTTAFDPYINFQTASTTRWRFGVDDSASDMLRITTSTIGNATVASGLSIEYSRGTVGIGATTTLSSANVARNSLIVGNGAICVDDGGDNCDDAVRSAGAIYGASTTISGLDIAENYPTLDETLEAGEIVAVRTINGEICERKGDNPDGSAYCAETATGTIPLVARNDPAQDNETRIIGVVSTKPGVLLGGFGNSRYLNYRQVPIALGGRVPVKISGENGNIEVGDRISLSSIPGVGARAINSGQVVGIALEDFTSVSSAEVGEILMFVDLGYQPLTASEGQDPELTLEGLAERQGELENRVALLELKLNELGTLDGLETQTHQDTGIGKQTIFGSIVDSLQSFGIKLKDGVFSVKDVIVGKVSVEKSDEKSENTIGEGVILAGATSTDILAPAIGIWDKVFITPETPISIGVMNKKPGEGFTVSISEPTSSDIYFDWWIIGVELKSQTPMTNDQSTTTANVTGSDPVTNCESRITYGWNSNLPDDVPLGAQNGGECKVFDTSCLPEGYVEVENCSTKKPIGDNSTSTYSGEEESPATSTETGIDGDNSTSTNDGTGNSSGSNSVSTDSGAENGTSADSVVLRYDNATSTNEGNSSTSTENN